MALPLWLRCHADSEGGDFEADAVARRCAQWIEAYELYWHRQSILALPASMEPGLIEGLEQEIANVPRRPSVRRGLSELLVELRIKRGELDMLSERLPLSALAESALEKAVARWVERAELQKALAAIDEWLQHSDSSRPMSLERRRREVLNQLGRADEVLDQLWQKYEAYPAADILAEIFGFAAKDQHEEVLARAIALAGDHARVLVEIAEKFEPSELLAEQIEETPIDELRKVSSWSLQAAAPKLESGWPEAAVVLYTALGWRHVDRGKPKYYCLATEAFERAHDLYRLLDRLDEWERIAHEVADKHGRKSSFMPRFRVIGEGHG